jgi:hypothetical protein
MKIRMGFVSNSSSASFTLTWKVYGIDDNTVEEAVKKVMDYASCEEEVIRSTKKIDRNVFKSMFWTSMLNCPSDIGNEAMDLYFSLAMNKDKFEIIDAKLEED